LKLGPVPAEPLLELEVAHEEHIKARAPIIKSDKIVFMGGDDERYQQEKEDTFGNQ
jgi:hypothetical protein